MTDAQFRATLIDSTFGRDAVLRVNLAGSGNEASGTLTFNTGVVLPLTGTVTPERDQRKVTLRGENSSIKADFYAYLPTPSSFNNILIKVDYQNLADGPFYALLVGGFD